jgi:hypothetical protein
VVISGVFSSGLYIPETGRYDCADINEKTESEEDGPIPAGDYFITDLPPGKARRDFYGLFANDGVFNDTTMWRKRGGFRLHPGTISTGCVTVPGRYDKPTQEWEKLDSLLSRTKTTVGGRKTGEKNNRTIFGVMHVR